MGECAPVLVGAVPIFHEFTAQLGLDLRVTLNRLFSAPALAVAPIDGHLILWVFLVRAFGRVIAVFRVLALLPDVAFELVLTGILLLGC